MSSDQSPFTLLQNLAAQVSDNAAPMPDRSKQADSWQAIAFEFMRTSFAIPMRDVKEVLPTPGVTRLPGVQKWVKGIANVRGEILALIDLNDFVSAGRASNPTLSRVVAVEKNGMHFGIIVDRVIGMRQINQTQIKEGAASDCPPEMKEYVLESIKLDDEQINLLDPIKLIESDTFAQVSTL